MWLPAFTMTVSVAATGAGDARVGEGDGRHLADQVELGMAVLPAPARPAGESQRHERQRKGDDDDDEEQFLHAGTSSGLCSRDDSFGASVSS
jgi:hypothetical protein